MFISFEGIDFCGKTTQIELLKRYLENKGRKVYIVREPGGTVISERIREILLNKKHLEMCDETEIFLFSGARAQLVREAIRPWLSEGNVVIADRFFDSTTAYQGYGRGIDLDSVKKIHQIATGGTVPDITFYLKISMAESIKRQELRKTDLDRIERSNDNFYERVISGYEQLALDNNERIVTINGSRSPEVIHEEIIEKLNEKMILSS
ncbi:MAG: dTMP kinase [Ignavibacteriales bacterium]|nr:MAG: dTMP kinase [Ignavibacteriaceae bacterium]MBW7873583.1 dTMP kinase [Ignavibacteria bacterium]MCZ2143814.1 dTMP kinase [Ignavibacteriales bacterium]OQY70590.1 MAG: dTMP kinase [Ignavibacteriales bacterium UTCHB3]MBV6445916.1 Thymidylate kinase [Ignavibacteriaceae bacterium]